MLSDDRYVHDSWTTESGFSSGWCLVGVMKGPLDKIEKKGTGEKECRLLVIIAGLLRSAHCFYFHLPC